MSRFDRCRETGGRAGQHYSGSPARSVTPVRLLALLVILATQLQSQTLLRIRILEGEGAVNSAGSKSERPIVAQITDETGRPLEGVAVSFRLPEEGPSGVFEGGMKTDLAVTTPEGRAAGHGIRWNQATGPIQIRVTAAKGESRAGAICSQYISDAPVARSLRSTRGGKSRWLTLAAITAGGAAAGLALAMRGSSPGAAQSPVAAQPVQIGLPTISIGKP